MYKTGDLLKCAERQMRFLPNYRLIKGGLAN